MRTRLVLVLLFGAAVYGMVYVGQRAAERKLNEETVSRESDGAGESVPALEGAETAVNSASEGAEPADNAVETLADVESVGAPTPESGAASSEVPPATAPAPDTVRRGGGLIEGYVYARGETVAGAEVKWRPAADSPYVPSSWSAPPLDDAAVQRGDRADLTTDNPLNPDGSGQIRLGGGFRAYDVAVARSFPTVPGTAYELTLDSRYAHGWWDHIYGEGYNINDLFAEYGIDLSGQTRDHESPAIKYKSVTNGPNSCWRRFRAEFTAEREKTSVWLRAAQLDPEIGCVWFDNLQIRPLLGEEEARKLAFTPDRENAGDDYPASVTTGPQGYYRIEGLPAGEYDLFASAPGRGSAEKVMVPLTAKESKSVNFNLLGGGVIRGRVLENITGKPIKGALVTLEVPARTRADISAPDIPENRLTRTGVSGEFYLHGLLPGVGYHVQVEAEGYTRPRMQSVAADGPDLTFALSPVGGVFGTVVQEGTGTPVDEAVVRVFKGRFRVAAAITGSDGRFSIRGLDPGKYAVIAEKEGRKSSSVTGEADTLTIASETEPISVNLEIPRGVRLRGKAVDAESKKPLEGIGLSLTMLKPGQRRYPTMFEEFLSGTAYRDMVGVLLLDSGEEADSAESGGNTSDGGAPGGEPADGAASGGTEIREDGYYAPRVCVTTDRDGRFEVEDIGLGRWEIGVRDRGYVFPRGTPVFVVDGKGEVEVEAALMPLDLIEGTVVDSDGMPVRGAKVWGRSMRLGEKEYTTFYEEIGIDFADADGRFRIAGLLPEVEYGLVATSRDGRLGTVEGIKAGDRNVELVVEPAGSIEGVIRYESGRPLVGRKVTALGGELYGIHWWRDGKTDGEGRFRLKELTKGVYDLDFGTREPELRARYGPVRVDAGEEIRDLELVIPGSGRITGAVRFDSGSGAPGVMVTAARQSEDGKPRYPMHWVGIEPNPWEDAREPALDFNILVYETMTDEAGEFVLEDLQAGTYTVKARFTATEASRAGGRQGLEQTVTIEDGGRAEVDLEMADPNKREPVPHYEFDINTTDRGEITGGGVRLESETVPLEGRGSFDSTDLEAITEDFESGVPVFQDSE